MGVLESPLSDTIIKDIPRSRKGMEPAYYKNKPQIERAMGLNSIENGFDSIELRLWYGYSIDDSSQLVVLKKGKNQKWISELCNFKYKYDERNNILTSIGKVCFDRTPKSGWDHFTRKLFDLEITDLPDAGKLPGYIDATDGGSIIIEVATSKLYRIYAYQLPSVNQEKFIQAKKMVDILRLIEEEFDFRRPRRL